MKKYWALVPVILVAALCALNFSCQKISCGLKSDLPWCPSTLKDADKEYAAGNYEQAISLYQAYLNDQPDAAKVEEVKGKISESYYQIGDRLFTGQNWLDAVNFYSQSQNPGAQPKISQAYFNLGEEAYAQGNFQTAVDYYSKSQEPGVQDKIQAAQDALALAQGATVAPGATVVPPKPPAPTALYAINIKAFSSKADAQEMLSEMKSNGVPGYTVGSDTKGWTLYAGKFTSRSKAESALGKLQGMGKKYRAAFIIKLK